MGYADNAWFVHFKKIENPKSRLICFHYAGGAASVFRGWAAFAPAECELLAVQMPGRWERLGEPLAHSMAELIPPLLQAIKPKIDVPYTLVGYSLGALVSFELARAIEAESLREPLALIAMSRSAPSHKSSRSPIFALPEEEFIRQMAVRYQALPRAILDEPEMRSLILPIVRADMEVYETYKCVQDARIKSPILALRGSKDPGISSEDTLAWREHTSATFNATEYESGHFFVADFEREVATLAFGTLP